MVSVPRGCPARSPSCTRGSGVSLVFSALFEASQKQPVLLPHRFQQEQDWTVAGSASSTRVHPRPVGREMPPRGHLPFQTEPCCAKKTASSTCRSPPGRREQLAAHVEAVNGAQLGFSLSLLFLITPGLSWDSPCAWGQMAKQLPRGCQPPSALMCALLGRRLVCALGSLLSALANSRRPRAMGVRRGKELWGGGQGASCELNPACTGFLLEKACAPPGKGNSLQKSIRCDLFFSLSTWENQRGISSLMGHTVIWLGNGNAFPISSCLGSSCLASRRGGSGSWPGLPQCQLFPGAGPCSQPAV